MDIKTLVLTEIQEDRTLEIYGVVMVRTDLITMEEAKAAIRAAHARSPLKGREHWNTPGVDTEKVIKLLDGRRGLVVLGMEICEVQEWSEATRIIESYDGGECPDCGDPISSEVTHGASCKNCEHVFNDPRELA
jgi:hypothetical protein